MIIITNAFYAQARDIWLHKGVHLFGLRFGLNGTVLITHGNSFDEIETKEITTLL